MKKHPLQIANEERAKTDPCRHCGFHNRADGGKGFHLYEAKCKSCGGSMDHSYLWAPWGMTWEQLQETKDKWNKIMEKYKRE
jgi:hypothetical protein